MQGKRCGKRDGEHLTFAWSDAQVRQIRCGNGPCSGAVDEGGWMQGAGGSVDFDGLVEGTNHADGSVGSQIDSCSADGGKESASQGTGIEAVLFKEDEAAVAVDKLRKEMGQLRGG